MSLSAEDARGGGEYERGMSPPLVRGVWGASPWKFLKFRMQESASETIFQWKKQWQFCCEMIILRWFLLIFFYKTPLWFHVINLMLSSDSTLEKSWHQQFGHYHSQSPHHLCGLLHLLCCCCWWWWCWWWWNNWGQWGTYIAGRFNMNWYYLIANWRAQKILLSFYRSLRQI